MISQRWQAFPCISGGCIPGQYDCSACEAESARRVQSRMSPKDRAYDRMVESASYNRREDGGCSCHINPPCNYCTSETEDESDGGPT